MNPRSSNHTRADSWIRRGITRGIPGCVIVIVIGLILANWFREYRRSQTIRQRLTGKWTEKVVRDNGSVDTYVWEFRPDGTVRDYQAGKPPKETGHLDDYLQWKVSGGELVLSWDHPFTREASVKQRLGQVVSSIDGVWRNKKLPLAFVDRCSIQEDGGDTVSFTLHPDETEADAYVPRNFTLTRAESARLK